jgi:hypothetical protein
MTMPRFGKYGSAAGESAEMKSRTALMTSAGCSMCGLWPARSMIRRRALGLPAAERRALRPSPPSLRIESSGHRSTDSAVRDYRPLLVPGWPWEAEPRYATLKRGGLAARPGRPCVKGAGNGWDHRRLRRIVQCSAGT